ncbi:MAG: matrixin family metalloprotease [Gemmatimonadaceae bacterium]
MSRRGDLIPVALLTGLAAFVGIQVAGARDHLPPAGAAATAVATDERGARATDGAADGLRASDHAAMLARLAAEGPGTYIDALIGVDSMLRRWPANPDAPSRVRVWVQPSSSLPGWRADQPSAVRDAFRAWERPGIPLRFAFTDDSAAADIRVEWVSRFPGAQQIGNSSRSYDQRGRILHASIALAVTGRNDRPLPERTARIAALHEVGHVIGLEHSPDPRDVMAARYDGQSPGIGAADLATARLLYALPSGRLELLGARK